MSVIAETSGRRDDSGQGDVGLPLLDDVLPQHEADLRLGRVLHLHQVAADASGADGATRRGGIIVGARAVEMAVGRLTLRGRGEVTEDKRDIKWLIRISIGSVTHMFFLVLSHP